MEKQEDKQVELDIKGIIDLPKVDVKPYAGKEVQIVKVRTFEGKYGYYVKMESEVLETLKGAKDDIIIKATRLFGLHEDDKGNIGWGEDTELGKFLAKHKVKTLGECVGLKVTTNIIEKNRTEFLSFV